MSRFGAFIAAILLTFTLSGQAVLAQVDTNRGVEVAQNRTLFDLLFGPKETTPPPAVTRPSTTRTTTTRRTTPAPARIVTLDVIEKTEGATRLAVFGDSLAIDLAKAFQRAFAEDPNLSILGKGVGSSGFVRDDFYDWDASLAEEILADSFDVAVVIIGINDKQALGGERPLSDGWKTLYLERLNSFLGQLREANKPVIWIGLPPMRASSYSAAVSEISSLHRLASVAAGIEFVDIYERFVDENGRYSSRGPNLNGEDSLMRKNDGIHFSSAGSDKVVFFARQSLRTFYRGGTLNLNISDPLEGTDALAMVRPPFQGNGQFRLLEVAGAVISISSEPARASELVLTPPGGNAPSSIDTDLLVMAPIGRADAFGVGVDRSLEESEENTPASPAT